MVYQINCQSCRQPLYFPNLSKSKETCLVAICRKCKYRYALVVTEVCSFSSTVEASPNNEHLTHRSHQLRGIQADGTLKSVEFSTLGRLEKISGLPGDQVLLLYTMRDKEPQDLVWIQNSTTKKSQVLIKPATKSRATGFATAALTLVGSSILAGFFQIPTNQLFWATSIPSSVGIGVFVTRRSSIKVRDCIELKRLSSEQQLLAQKHELEQKIARLTTDLQTTQKLVQRLKALGQKMIGIGEEMYVNQAETVSKAVTVLEKQLDLTLNLINGYLQLDEIIEIEHETFQLTEHLPGDVLTKMLNQLEQLKVIESTKEELSLLVNPQQILAECQLK